MSFALLLRLRFGVGFDFGLGLFGFGRLGFGFGTSGKLRLDQLVSFRVHAAETVLDLNFALVEEVDEDLHILIKFVRHVKESVLHRF